MSGATYYKVLYDNKFILFIKYNPRAKGRDVKGKYKMEFENNVNVFKTLFDDTRWKEKGIATSLNKRYSDDLLTKDANSLLKGYDTYIPIIDIVTLKKGKRGFSTYPLSTTTIAANLKDDGVALIMLNTKFNNELLYLDGKGTVSDMHLDINRFKQGEIFINALMGCKVYLERNRLMKDIELLRKHNIMDYSLSVSVNEDGLTAIPSESLPASIGDDIKNLIKDCISNIKTSLDLEAPGADLYIKKLKGTYKDYLKNYKSTRINKYSTYRVENERDYKQYHYIEADNIKIAVDLWDIKYKSILYILGFPSPFMEVNARKKLEDAMDAVISTASKVKSKGTPKLEFRYYLEKGNSNIINLRREWARREIDDGSYVNIDLTDAVNGKQIFKEQFLDKVPHVQLQLGSKDSEGCMVSLIDISQPWNYKKKNELNYKKKKTIHFRYKTNRTPGCKNLAYDNLNKLDDCSPCFISACKSEPYFTRFKAWIDKIMSSDSNTLGGGKGRRRRRRQTRRKQTRKRKTRRKRN